MRFLRNQCITMPDFIEIRAAVYPLKPDRPTLEHIYIYIILVRITIRI